MMVALGESMHFGPDSEPKAEKGESFGSTVGAGPHDGVKAEAEKVWPSFSLRSKSEMGWNLMELSRFKLGKGAPRTQAVTTRDPL